MDGRSLLRNELAKERPDKEIVRSICLTSLEGNIPDELRVDVWMVLLDVDTTNRFMLDDSIRETKQDMENQRVIRVDTNRTRADLQAFRKDETKALIAKLLTYYCKQKGIKYKQGLNEVLAPFIILREDPFLPDGIIYNLYSKFIDKFLPHIYSQEDFIALQSTLRLFRLVLQYHDPELCHLLDQYNLVPELYATSWFLTLFARNIPLQLLYKVWDRYLLNDTTDGKVMHFFHCVSFIILNHAVIMKAPPSDLPILLTSIIGQDTSSTGEDVIPMEDNDHDEVENLSKEELCKMESMEELDRIFALGNTLKLDSPSAISKELYFVLFESSTATLSDVEFYENLPCVFNNVSDLIENSSNERVVVLDCRSEEEFMLAHMKDSYHLNPDVLSRPEMLTLTIENLRKALGEQREMKHYVVYGSDTQDKSVHVMFILHLLQRGFKHVSFLRGQWEALRPSIETVCGPPKVALFKAEDLMPHQRRSLQQSTWFDKMITNFDKTKADVMNFGETSKNWFTAQTAALSQDLNKGKKILNQIGSILQGQQETRSDSKSKRQEESQNRSTSTVRTSSAKVEEVFLQGWFDLSLWAVNFTESKISMSLFDAQSVVYIDNVLSFNDNDLQLPCIIAIGNSHIYELQRGEESTK